MRPDQCGTHRLPPDGTPDREAVDQFADFLTDKHLTDAGEMPADKFAEKWDAYMRGEESLT